MLELEETKLFLRVDGSEEDSVISSLIITGTELVAGVLRRDLTEFEILPETIKQAILVVVATLFEERQITKTDKSGMTISEVLSFVKSMCFEYRREAW